MKVRLSILILFFFITFSTKAVTLSGIVHDSVSKNPIEFCNIVLLNSDSTFYQGTITNEEGYFEFNSMNKGDYILKITCLGYLENYENVSVTENVRINIFLIKSNYNLNEVVIMGKEPLFTMKNGSLITNVSTTLLGSLGTASDVVQRIPGVMTIDEKISVFGKGIPLIYINNRLLTDPTELDRLVSSEISTVELITNPDSRYDAQGKAVLIIKTKKKQSGWATNISERLTQGSHLGDAENINLSYNNNAISIFASYYHGYQKTKIDESNSYNVLSNDSWNHEINSPYYYSYYSNQFSTGLDWSINTKHTLGIQYQFFSQNADNNMFINGISYLNDKLYDNFTSNSHIKEKPYRHMINGFYNTIFNENLSLHVDVDYINNHTQRDQNTQELSTLENREINTMSQSDFHLYAGKLLVDYKSSIGSFIFGGEYNQIDGNGSLSSKEDIINDNIFKNKEQKSALFINYSQNINDFKLDMGMRYEYSHEKNIESNNEVVSDRKYYSVYPNLSLSKKFKDWSLSLQLNKRVQRPSFAELNDNVIYINRLVLQKGNSNLKKVDIYSINIQAMYKKFYLNLGYKYEKNPIVFINEFDNSTSSIYMYTKNYPKYQELNLMINYRDKIKFWEINYYSGVTQPFFSDNYNNQKYSYNNPSIIFRAYNDIILPQQFTVSLNYLYQSENIYYTMKRGDYNRLDIGLRKSLLDNTLKLNIEVRDIFNWTKERNTININNISFYQKKKRETRFVVFTINYLFNNYKKKYRGTSASGDDIYRL